MVSICLISKSSPPLTNLWEIVRNAPIIIGISTTFIFHSYFSSLASSKYLYVFSLSFNFNLCSTVKPTIRQVLFLLTNFRFGRLAEVRWFVCISKSLETFLIFLYGFWVVLVRSNSSSLHTTQWIPFPIQLFLVLYSFGVNFLHSLIICVVFWLVNTSSSNNKETTICEENSYIHRKEYLQEKNC